MTSTAQTMTASSLCMVKEGLSARNWYVCPDCRSCRDWPMTICNSSLDTGLAASLGLWGQSSANPLRRQICIALETIRFREDVIDEYTHRCDPSYVCKDIFLACPWVVEIRRASTSDLRRALLRVTKHFPPANTSRLEDVSGRAGEVPTEGTSLLMMAPQTCVSGFRRPCKATYHLFPKFVAGRVAPILSGRRHSGKNFLSFQISSSGGELTAFLKVPPLV